MLGDKSVLMMGNHGVLVVGETIPQAFERLYFLERAAQAQVIALSTGRALKPVPEKVVKATVAQFSSGGQVGGRDRARPAFRCAEAAARSPARGLRELNPLITPGANPTDAARPERSPDGGV